MKLLLRLLLSFAALLLVLYVWGLTIPEQHRAASMARVHAAPVEIWELIADIEGWADWRADVTGVERLPDRDGQPTYRVKGPREDMLLVLTEVTPPRRLTATIPADAGLPFSGSWTWQVSPADEATAVTIIEDGRIDAALFRTFARLMGYHTTMDAFLEEIGEHFGEDVTPQAIPQAVLGD